eukprot:Em0003g1387a
MAKCELFSRGDIEAFPADIKVFHEPNFEILGAPIGDAIFCAKFLTQKARLGGQLEVGRGYGAESSLSRPTDILVPNWMIGKPAAFDLTVVSPLNSTTLNEAGARSGSAAGKAEVRKHNANDAKCTELVQYSVSNDNNDFGHHFLTCKHGGDVVSRHNKLRDVFYDFCQRACLGPRLEMGCGAGSDSQSRPADVLVPNWDLGKPAAFDLSVTSTLQSSALLEASVTAGSAAQLAENRKHNNSDKKCDELGWACIPLVVETYGCWGAEAVAALSGRLSVRNNEQKSKTIFSLYSRLGLTLVRANCRAILSRLT